MPLSSFTRCNSRWVLAFLILSLHAQTVALQSIIFTASIFCIIPCYVWVLLGAPCLFMQAFWQFLLLLIGVDCSWTCKSWSLNFTQFLCTLLPSRALSHMTLSSASLSGQNLLSLSAVFPSCFLPSPLLPGFWNLLAQDHCRWGCFQPAHPQPDLFAYKLKFLKIEICSRKVNISSVWQTRIFLNILNVLFKMILPFCPLNCMYCECL